MASRARPVPGPAGGERDRAARGGTADPVTRGRAGESFLERPKAEHRMFRNPSKDKPLRFVVTYTIPIGKAPVEF